MFEKEIVHLLNKQKWFVDELLLITPGNRELVAITLWETKVYADIYNHELYPKVEKMVERYLEGVLQFLRTSRRDIPRSTKLPSR